MILHLLTDDKFADYAIKQFSSPEMNSDFVLIPSNNENWVMKLAGRCTIVEQNSPDFEDMLNRLGQYTGIIIHGMFWGNWQRFVLERVPSFVKVAWVFWGGEIYSRHEFSYRFFAPITSMTYKIYSLKKRNKNNYNWEIPLELYKRIDYCLTDIQEEYHLGKQLSGASYKHLWYNYYSIEETIGLLANEQSRGNNIWIGNSAAIKNNHLDVLWNMWRGSIIRQLKNKEIIIPLSYGHSWVRNLVAKISRFIFGEHLRPLAEFMPLEDYNSLMLSCSTLILGYREPAAQGNIITGLWLGMRVYLSERSASYDYFKRIGCKIYSIEHDLNHKNPDVFAPMKQEDIDSNRAVLRIWYAKEEMHKRNLEIVKALS